jgi:carboxypeptidase family protein
MRLTTWLIRILAVAGVTFGVQTSPPAVSGVVKDDAGVAIVGAVVAAKRTDGIASTYPAIRSRPTDASGRYAFENLDRGIYVFSVTISSDAAPIPSGILKLAPGVGIRDAASANMTVVDRDARSFVTIAGPLPVADGKSLTSLYPPTFHGGGAVLPRARLVQVDPERPRTDIDIVVPRKPAVRVAGVLTIVFPQGYSDSGAPQRLVVRLLPADTPVMPPRGAASDAQPIATALADESGAFVFPAVPAGEYVIDAYRAMPPPTVSVSPNGLPVVTPPDRVDGDPQGLAAAQSITLEHDVDDLRLTLRPTGPASRAAIEARAARGLGGGPPGRGTGGLGAGGGRALPGGPRGAGAIAGRLVDADGAPLAGVQILAAQARGSDLLPIGPPAITDADGRYRLAGLAPGTYAIVAPAIVSGIGSFDFVPNAFPRASSTGGRKTGYVTTFYPATADVARATFIDISGQAREGIDVAVQRVGVTDLTVSIAGASASDLVFLLPDDRRAQLGGRNVIRMRVSSGGDFTIRDVPDGRYTLKFSSPRGWIREPVVLPDAASALPLRPVLQPYVSISGRVIIDEESLARGATLPARLSVEIRPDLPTVGDSMTPGIVQPDGTFTVARVIPGARYFMRVTVTPPWRQTAGTISGADAFSEPLTITTAATDARVVISSR